jgi:hypothetical protein
MNISYKIALTRSWMIESRECIKCLVRKLKGHRTFFNPKTHQGYLPVRVLQHNIISWLETASPEFFVLLKDETSYNGLQQDIEYNITTTKIVDAAYLSPSQKINLFENFVTVQQYYKEIGLHNKAHSIA